MAVNPVSNLCHMWQVKSVSLDLVLCGATVIDEPDPDVGELFDHVYAETPPLLAAQREQLLAEMAKEG